MTSPSGKVMLSGWVALRLLRMLTWGSRKCAVAPESAIAVSAPRARWILSLVSVSLSSSESKSERAAVATVASSESLVHCCCCFLE